VAEISQLEAAGAFWDWVSFISLVFAVLAAITEFVTNWTNWVNSPWKSKIEKTSALIVLLGSAAGLVATWKLSNINTRIIAILNTEVANAQERAAKAEEAAANALKATKEAETQARKFESQIALSNARAEEAKKIAEREKLERVKLEAQVAPRRLSVEQGKGTLLTSWTNAGSISSKPQTSIFPVGAQPRRLLRQNLPPVCTPMPLLSWAASHVGSRF